jgi:hypothetical protein
MSLKFRRFLLPFLGWAFLAGIVGGIGYLWWRSYHWERSAFTREKFERSIAARPSTLADWHRLIKAEGAPPYASGTAEKRRGSVMEQRQPYEKRDGEVIWYEGYSEADARWRYDVTCMELRHSLPFAQYDYYYYDLIFADDMKIIGYRR